MLAYIARRILLMIPTLFGILLISFMVVQFAPGGPVERVIAQLQGQDQGATAQFQRRRRRSRRLGTIAGERNSRYRGAQGLDPKFIAELEQAIRLRQAGARALPDHAEGLCDIRFRPQLFPRRAGARIDPREAAGLDLARPVDDAALLCDLDSARHPQGGEGRNAVRYLRPRRWSSSAMRFRASCSPSC